MPLVPQTEDLSTEIADIKRRLRDLETQARNPALSVAALGVQAAQVDASEGTTGYLFTDITTGPSITVTVPGTVNGRVLLFYGATITDASGAGFANGSEIIFFQDGVVIDPAGPEHLVRRLTYDIGDSGSTFSLSRSYLVTGLTPGAHTFKLMYCANSDVTRTVNFSNRFIIGIPIA